MKASLYVGILAVACLTLAATANAGDYIVVLKDGVHAGAVMNPTAAAAARRAVQAAAKRHRAVPAFVYAHALRGYAATLSDAALARAQADPAVAFVAEDREVSLPEPVGNIIAAKKTPGGFPLPNQITPFGVVRVGGKLSPTAKIDGIDERVNVDIAILDTGVQRDHPDLNVVGGLDCNKKGGAFADLDGHGTHVAGIAAAIDNAFGVVGVAPGARIWAVKVLGDNGKGKLSSLLCGVDWVTANSSLIDVANASVIAKGADDGNCGQTNRDPLHGAICAAVANGVTIVVAAGNDSADVADFVPTGYDEVTTVAAIADYNGQPGGGAAPLPDCLDETDDTMAFFSNFGQDVDMAAPGVCITSTFLGSSYWTMHGTSMASPNVAGAAALYKANNPTASPADVKAALIANWEPGPIPEDPDTFSEGVVNVSTF